MLNTWWFNLILYIIFYVIFSQTFKVATKKSNKDGALTILLQVIGGVFILLLAPLFKFQFPTNYKTYLFLVAACIFYAITDRVNTTARRGLNVSTYSILSQLSTAFLIIFGVVLFKETLVLKKVIGAILILSGNVLSLYKKGKFELNKYVLFSLLGNLSMAIGVSIDVGISNKFNMPIYIAITLLLPSLILFIVQKVKVKDIINEYKKGDKKAIILVGCSWGTWIIAMIRAYQFGSVTTVAPIASVTTIINVLVAYLLLKEKDSIAKKVLAAIFVIIGIILIKM